MVDSITGNRGFPDYILLKLDSSTLSHIFSFLDKLKELPILLLTSRALRLHVCTAHSVWSEGSLDICLVGSDLCFGCGRTPLTWRTTEFLFTNAQVSVARLHISFADLARTCGALSKCKSLTNLHIRLYCRGGAATFRTLEPLPALQCAARLSYLAIFGWPETRGEPLYHAHHSCASLLNFVGANLLSLKFQESVPRDAFEAIRAYCPLLQSLVLEGFRRITDISDFCHESLQSLSVESANVTWSKPLQLPKLLSFKCGCNLEEQDSQRAAQRIHLAVGQLPPSLTTLTLLIDSSLAEETVIAISESLPQLSLLALKLQDGTVFTEAAAGAATEMGRPTRRRLSFHAARALCTGCQKLETFDLCGGHLGVSRDAFVILCALPRLRRLSLLYDEDVVATTPTAAGDSNSLEEIIFFEFSQRIFSSLPPQEVAELWTEMEDNVTAAAERCPSISISLVDCDNIW